MKNSIHMKIFYKIINSKYYNSVSKLEHYYYYIAIMLTGILYIIDRKINIPYYNLIFTVFVLINCICLIWAKANKSVLIYLLLAILMILTKYNVIMFVSNMNILLLIYLFSCGIIGILVNYRFNVKYKLTIIFICLSLVLSSLVLDTFISNFIVRRFDSNTYGLLIMGIISADIALIVGMISTSNHFKTLFDKKICGIGLNIISKYINVKRGLIIEDNYFIEKESCFNISEVSMIYTIYVNTKTCITISVFSILANLLFLFSWDLNLITIMTILSIIYCLKCIAYIKFSTSDQEIFENLIINFLKYILSNSRNMEIIEWIKDNVNIQECTEKEKLRLTTVFIETSQIDYNKNIKESSKKTKLLTEMINKTTGKSVPNIII